MICKKELLIETWKTKQRKKQGLINNASKNKKLYRKGNLRHKQCLPRHAKVNKHWVLI